MQSPLEMEQVALANMVTWTLKLCANLSCALLNWKEEYYNAQNAS